MRANVLIKVFNWLPLYIWNSIDCFFGHIGYLQVFNLFYHLLSIYCLLSFLDIAVPSYLISCSNCGHGTDMRGCPQSPLSIEGIQSLFQLCTGKNILKFLMNTHTENRILKVSDSERVSITWFSYAYGWSIWIPTRLNLNQFWVAISQ